MAARGSSSKFRRPTPAEALAIVRGLGLSQPQAAAAAAAGAPAALAPGRRGPAALRGPRRRGDPPPLRRLQRFYECVLGPSMTYTCAVYPTEDATLEEAQADKYDLVARKLDLQPGQRLLDVGCGWGGMVRHAAREYGVQGARRDAVAASRRRGRRRRSSARASTTSPRSGTATTATSPRPTSTPISSIGLTEHIGVRNYPAYFGFLRDHLAPQGRLLNHCITRPHNRTSDDRRVHRPLRLPRRRAHRRPGRIITAAQDAGLEVQHEENIRMHYAKTLAGWCRNLVDNWDECVAEVGEGTARVWGLYMAGSRIAFERNEIQLHHVLGGQDRRRRPATGSRYVQIGKRQEDILGSSSISPLRSTTQWWQSP